MSGGAGPVWPADGHTMIVVGPRRERLVALVASLFAGQSPQLASRYRAG